MDLTAVVFSSGWAGGANAHATVGVLGLLSRFTDTSRRTWWAPGIAASVLVAGAATVLPLWRTISRARGRRRNVTP